MEANRCSLQSPYGMEDDRDMNNSNEICDGESCVSDLTPRSGDRYCNHMRKLQPGRTILSSKISDSDTQFKSRDNVKTNDSNKSGDNYCKSTGIDTALSDLTNTINASRRSLKSIFQDNGDDCIVRFLSKEFEHISVVPSSLHNEGFFSTRKRSCNLEYQSNNLTIGGHSKHRKLEQQLSSKDCMKQKQVAENKAHFEADRGTNIGHNGIATRRSTISNNKENFDPARAEQDFVTLGNKENGSTSTALGSRENGSTSTALRNIDIPESSSSSRKRRYCDKDKHIRLGKGHVSNDEVKMDSAKEKSLVMLKQLYILLSSKSEAFLMPIF
ncbi:hypothetical protein RIF29_19828 [Crotalaria pallida]|uniref:Uncharacterized protein n=1 Tax=Crotalaria pallida TaxID=3830 RepID=A0AAN9F065_CROPI